MHIKFIFPKAHIPVYSPLKFRLVPPQALLLLATLTPPPHTCEIIDENLHECDCTDTPDLVAISVYINVAYRAYHLADRYRARNIPVVLGGLHVTACPDEAQCHADAIVVGEADNIWSQLLDDIEHGNLKPLYTGRERVSLAHLSPLKTNLVNRSSYASIHAMCTSRGCSHRCDFCYQSSFYSLPGVRHKPLDNIIREIQLMRARHVLFLDDNLVANKQFAHELFTALQHLEITWSGAVTANIGEDTALLALAYASGCRSLFIGFESLSHDNLKHNHKRQNHPARYEAQVANIHHQKIMINCSFVFGFDHDTPAVFTETVDWIVKVGIESVNFHILTPYPGTPLFAEMKASGRIIDYNWEHYNTTRAVFQPKHMSPRELEEGYLWARQNVYSWKNILARVPRCGTSPLVYWVFMLSCIKFPSFTNLLGKMGFLNKFFTFGHRLF